MREYSRFQILTAQLSALFQPNKRKFKTKEVLTGELAGELLESYSSDLPLSLARVNPYMTRLLYEFNKGKGKEVDYSKKLYLPDDYRINSTLGTISKFSLDHVANEYLKCLDKVDFLIFERLRKDERLLIKNSKSNMFLLNDNEFLYNCNLLKLLDNKRVLTISPHAELIKIQHLHQEVFHRDIEGVKGNFELLALSSEEIFHREQAYSLFDKEDALKVEILKYDFDIALLDLGLLGLPIAAFIATLDKKVFDLEEQLYQVFGIALDSAEKSQHDKFWVDLSSYKKGVESTFLATGVIGAPIKIRRRKGDKRVH